MISSWCFPYYIICAFFVFGIDLPQENLHVLLFFLSVEQAYINQRKLETEAKQLQAHAGTTCFADSVTIMSLF